MQRTLCLGLSLVALVFYAALAEAGSRQRETDARERIRTAAAAFLESLRPELRAKAALAFDDRARKDWHYIPRERPGVRLRDMNDAERTAAHGLLRTALSSRGYLKADAIMQLDQVLRDMSIASGKEDASRDPLQYTFTVFGTPGAEHPWGWRVEGHHVSLNFTLTKSAMVAVTPAFFGASPVEVRTGGHAGFRPLAAEDDLGHELLAMLDEGQRKKAVLATDVPRDITAVPGRGANEVEAGSGLPVHEMSRDQLAVLDRLIEEFVRNMQDDVAVPHLERIRAEAAQTMFAWIGSAEPGKPHYYRVRGPRWIIEFDTTTADASHIHTVWRDFDHDFGGDLLGEHYKDREHGEHPDR